MTRKLLKQALDALDYCPDDNPVVLKVFEAISAELAKPEPAPVAWVVTQGARKFYMSPQDFTRGSYDSGSFVPLYAAPQPLPDVAQAVADERERCITAAEDAYIAGKGAKGCIDAIRNRAAALPPACDDGEPPIILDVALPPDGC